MTAATKDAILSWIGICLVISLVLSMGLWVPSQMYLESSECGIKHVAEWERITFIGLDKAGNVFVVISLPNLNRPNSDTTYTTTLSPFPKDGAFAKFIVVKFDPNFHLIWSRFFGSPDGYISVFSFMVTPDGGLLVFGLDQTKSLQNEVTSSLGNGENMAFLAKIDSKGEVDYFSAIFGDWYGGGKFGVDSEGSVILELGGSFGLNASSQEMEGKWIFFYDMIGTHRWLYKLPFETRIIQSSIIPTSVDLLVEEGKNYYVQSLNKLDGSVSQKIPINNKAIKVRNPLFTHDQNGIILFQTFANSSGWWIERRSIEKNMTMAFQISQKPENATFVSLELTNSGLLFSAVGISPSFEVHELSWEGSKKFTVQSFGYNLEMTLGFSGKISLRNSLPIFSYSEGNFLLGLTLSEPPFPLKNVFQNSVEGESDPFVSMFSHEYSKGTFFGGPGTIVTIC